MNLKSILERSKRYPPEIILKKAVRKSFILAQDYLRYVNDAIFGTELTDNDLYKKIEERIKDASFKSVSEYITYVLQEIIENSEEEEETFSEEEEEKIKERLRALGYLD